MGIERTGTIPYVICTSGTHPASPVQGQLIFETDTNKILYYDGASWLLATQPGSVVQVVNVRSDNRTTFSAPTSGNGTTVTELNLSITPRYTNSWVLCDWMINGEMHQDTVWLIHKGGVLQTSPAGYNTAIGNVQWSGYVVHPYDADLASTPNNINIKYIDTNLGGTTARTYAPAIRSSNAAAAQTLFLNNNAANLSQAAYESAVSFGVAWEIRQ